MALYNVLVVDDELSNLSALKRLLRHRYNVFSATSGEDALAVMRQRDIALTIVDHRMPSMTGIELLEKIFRRYPDTIRIMLTAYASEKLLIDAINRIHAHGFITKPWEPEEIESIVAKWIANYSKGHKSTNGKWKRRVFGQRKTNELDVR